MLFRSISAQQTGRPNPFGQQQEPQQQQQQAVSSLSQLSLVVLTQLAAQQPLLRPLKGSSSSISFRCPHWLLLSFFFLVSLLVYPLPDSLDFSSRIFDTLSLSTTFSSRDDEREEGRGQGLRSEITNLFLLPLSFSLLSSDGKLRPPQLTSINATAHPLPAPHLPRPPPHLRLLLLPPRVLGPPRERARLGTMEDDAPPF